MMGGGEKLFNLRQRLMRAPAGLGSGLWTRRENRFATDSPLEGTGFELLVRGRVKLVVGADGSENRTARRRRCRCASVTFDQLVPRTRAGGASTSLCSTVGPRTAPRTPFHRSRDRARYRYYEGSRSGPAVTACQHYFESRSFSREGKGRQISGAASRLQRCGAVRLHSREAPHLQHLHTGSLD